MSPNDREKSMPLKLNIGLSKKFGEANYGSRGASINLELELEAALVNEPAKLRDKITQAFNLVRSSLAEELNGNGHNGQEHTPPANNANSNGAAGASNQRTTPQRPATQSQVKAIIAIARSQKLDLRPLLQHRFQISRPDDLSIKEASALIDDLKSDNRKGS